ncbi:MAG: O-antigen ligase family protein [Desulfobacula sp.]|nr:O-antigen ligase family protein [Desulfobacula sp.]
MPLTAILMYILLGCLWLGAFIRPVYGVVGYLVIYSIYNPYAWWVVTTNGFLPRPSVIAMAFLVAAALINIRKLNWRISRKEWLFYLFLVFCWISTFIFGTTVEADTWEYVNKITKIFIFIFFFIRIVNSLKDYKIVVWTFILCAIFIAYQAHSMEGIGRLDRLGGIDFGEANGLAAYMGISVIFLGFQMLRFPLLWQVIPIIGIALFLNTIIFTESRSIFLGFVFVIPYVFLNAPSEKLKQICLYAVLGIILFFMLMDTSFIDRMSTIGEETQSVENSESNMIDDRVSLSRIDFWKASIRIFRDHPMGIGVKNFYKVVPFYDPFNPGMDAHNTYVLCYSEIGIFGICIFMFILIETVLQIKRIRLLSQGSIYKDEIRYHLISIGSILIMLCLGYMMTHSNLYVESFWIVLSLPICLENATKNSLELNNYKKL